MLLLQELTKVVPFMNLDNIYILTVQVLKYCEVTYTVLFDFITICYKKLLKAKDL